MIHQMWHDAAASFIRTCRKRSAPDGQGMRISFITAVVALVAGCAKQLPADADSVAAFVAVARGASPGASSSVLRLCAEGEAISASRRKGRTGDDLANYYRDRWLVSEVSQALHRDPRLAGVQVRADKGMIYLDGAAPSDAAATAALIESLRDPVVVGVVSRVSTPASPHLRLATGRCW
jgi:hypothetical protein